MTNQTVSEASAPDKKPRTMRGIVGRKAAEPALPAAVAAPPEFELIVEWVALQELYELGGTDEDRARMCGAEGIEVRRRYNGDLAISSVDAGPLVEKRRRENAEHAARRDAYEVYTRKCYEDALNKRRADAAAERERVKRLNDAAREKYYAEQAKLAAVASADRQRQNEELNGNPMPMSEWLAGEGGV